MAANLFTLDPAPTFAWDVALTAPGGESRPLRVVYRHMGKERLALWRAEVAMRPESDELDILLEVMAGWENTDQPFSREALSRLLDNHHRAAEELYLGFLQGLAGARRGN